MLRMSLGLALIGSFSALVVGCSSAEMKQRQEMRDRVVQSSKIYCEFVNGDNNPDIDVATNIAMGAKCDASKPFSMTNYRTPSEINGVMFCCAVRDPKAEATYPPVTKVPPKIAEPKADAAAPAAIAAPTPTPTPQVVPQVAPAATPVPTADVTKTEVRVKSEAKSESKSATKTEVKVDNKPKIQFEASPDLDQ